MNKFPLFLLLLFPLQIYSQEVSYQQELNRLYEKFDKDKDKKITIEDAIPPKAAFTIKGHPEIKAQGYYEISNLAQELKWSEISKKPLEKKHIKENPVVRISRSIREIYWDGLTRRIDGTTLQEVLKDPKVFGEKKYLYVPHDDEDSFNYYKKLGLKNVEVVKLPKVIPPGYVTSLKEKQGLLALALKDGKGVPYVVPGGRFNEMYGWDTYFHVLGTLEDDRLDLAKGMVDNFIYEINHYGKILNANRTYYLSRSQPPFFTSMVRAVEERLPSTPEKKEWLSQALKAAVKEYKTVWMGEERLTDTGLSRYGGFDTGVPPEVEPGHFDHVLQPFAKKHQMTVEELIHKFNEGKIKDKKLTEFFSQDRAVRESGHDTTFRWRVGDEDRASDFVTVDLNSLLYKYELDLAHLMDKHFKGDFSGEKAQKYREAAAKRKKLMRKYLWDEERGLFFDYNWNLKKPSSYISATTFYPLWASSDHDDEYDILSQKEARKLVREGLKHLEQNGGVAATAAESLKAVSGKEMERQWDYPNGWAPHQILIWKGLENYGFKEDAQRLAYKWLFMITKNARDYNGTVPEKYDVVEMSHKVFAEYGNVGTDFAYITKEGFGWMNASYQIGLKLLPEEYLRELKKLTPPSQVQKNKN